MLLAGVLVPAGTTLVTPGLNVVGVCATVRAISAKFDQFIEERGLD